MTWRVLSARPWVKSDLSDLHAQFKWAEENPRDARKIARQGTRWAREFISNSGVRRWAARAVTAPVQALDARLDAAGGRPTSFEQVEKQYTDMDFTLVRTARYTTKGDLLESESLHAAAAAGSNDAHL